MENKDVDLNVAQILKNTPYNTYNDLFNAIYNGKATIKILRGDASQIASVKHPYSIFSLYLGFLITTLMIIYFSVISSNYWLLLLVPINLILQTIITYIPKLKIIAFSILMIDLFIIKLYNWIAIECLAVLLISFFYNIWWNKTYKYAIKEMSLNKEAFLWSWNKYGFSIEDSYGNSYSKISIDYPTEQQSDTTTTSSNSDNDVLLSIISNPDKLSSIIDGTEKIDENLLLNKQNPYTGETILNYDDIIKYLKMYELDFNGIDPLGMEGNIILTNKN